MKLVSWIFFVLLLLLALGFALNNRQTTTLNLWPAGVVIEAPLYLFSLGTFFAGFVLGALTGWIGHIPHRMEARRLRRDVGKLREKIEDMSSALPDAAENTEIRRSKSFFRRTRS
jgi:uncharacterized integral membrane protein